MQVGDLVKMKHVNLGLGVVTKVNKRDLSFYKSHTYLVQFPSNGGKWCLLDDLEVVCK